MVSKLRGSIRTGTKEDESSTGRVWAAGYHHVTARSRLARVLKIMKRFSFCYRARVLYILKNQIFALKYTLKAFAY